ncbi:MAG: hypothetical protein H7Z42_21755 [Roseiflexaceae bacterium]|nr:hypothetical protein [Roseiflexaceae bacterium]
MRGLALLRDERGAQTVSWVGLTAAMTALLLVMYSVLNGNAMLRGAVTNATSRLAIEFGQDITFGAPRMARPPGAVLGGAERGTAIEFGATAGGATEYGATAGSATEYGAT